MSIRTRLRIWLIILISTFGVCWSTAQAKIIYVDADPILPGQDGASWPSAFKYLQNALSAAEYGDQIWVAAGTYKPTKLTDPNDSRTATFQMINGVAIYGGFPDMGIPDFTDRDPDIYETILSGDLNGDDIIEPNKTENSYHVVIASYTDPNTILDGFIITAGNASGPEPHNRGGGMYNTFGNPQLANCTFTGNAAYGDGGGIGNTDYSSPMVTCCVFTGNSAGYSGGGIFNELHSNPTLTNCTFSGNVAESGGGMSNMHNSNPTLTNCILWDGGDEIYNNDGSTITITYSDVQDGWSGEGNIDAVPCFVDPGYWDPNDDFWVDGDYHLLPNSPCIDTGDPCYLTGPGDFDKDGNLRVVDGDGDGTARIDMGAYEFQKKYCGGAGTAEEPYLVCAPLHLQQIGDNPDDWDRYFKLTADINLSAYTPAQFNIIGWYEDGQNNEPFTGVFDGNDHTISNFTHTSAGTDNVGLFGYIAGPTAQIKNLVLIDPNINSTTGTSIGALAGFIGDGATVSDCHVKGGTVSGNEIVGGLAGRTVDATVSSCSAQCDVTGNRLGVGGLIGDALQTTISKCYATGSVAADNWGIGGLVGHQYAGQILASYATGPVSGIDNGIGGLVGNAEGVYIEHCYAAGSVDGVDEVGGFAGRYSDGDILASFWDTLATGQVDGIGCEEQVGTVELFGRNTTQMRQRDTFTDYGWDFAGETANGTEDVWTIWETAYYPRLTWENPLAGDFTIDGKWIYQNVLNSTNSKLTAAASITNDPLENTSFTYEWEFILPDDVSVSPAPLVGCGNSDPCCTFAAPGCNQPAGLSDSGRPLTIQVTVTGDDHGNTGKAQAEFGIALLGDVNNDCAVNVADRAIINAFWRTGAAGPYSFTDCNINCDSVVNVADRAIANAVWRGVLGQNSVSQPCPLR